MKKLIALILALVLCVPFGLCGCEKKEKGTEVEITIDNITDYFGVEKTITNFEYNKSGLSPASQTVTSASATINVRIYKKVDCKVKDVSFTIGLKAWDDDVWESYDNLEFVTLPEDGSFEWSYNVKMKKNAVAYEVLPYMPFEEPGYSFLFGGLKGSVIVPTE